MVTRHTLWAITTMFPITFTHSFYKHVFSVYYVPGTVLGAGDTAKNKTDKNHCPNGVDILMGGKQKISK